MDDKGKKHPYKGKFNGPGQDAVIHLSHSNDNMIKPNDNSERSPHTRP